MEKPMPWSRWICGPFLLASDLCSTDQQTRHPLCPPETSRHLRHLDDGALQSLSTQALQEAEDLSNTSTFADALDLHWTVAVWCPQQVCANVPI